MTIRYKCLKCGDVVESSPQLHVMNWCSCRSVGVDDHSRDDRIRVCGSPENMAFYKDGEFINVSDLDEQERSEEMKREMMCFDLYTLPSESKISDQYDWWESDLTPPFESGGLGVLGDVLCEHPCGCGSGHNVRTYRDCYHQYDGYWWRCYCLIDHLLDKFEGGDNNATTAG